MTAEPDPRPQDPPQGSPTGPSRAPERPDIPGYEVDGVIGRGASGVVYRARQLAVDREVALKVLLPELSRNPRIVQRLKREARTTARLAHPNVISAIDMGEVDGRWWYAMELVEGGTLSRLVKQEGKLEERTVLRLFIPLVEALVHLAEHGVVHRDIKPANILIDVRTGLARLADLGLAFADDDPERTVQASGTLGTPAFMSPEQAVDAAAADAQSDLWSLGATLFHALVGRPPFTGVSAAEVLTEVLHAPIPDPQALVPELSTGLALVVRKCLTRDRNARYLSARELLADLERVRERRAPRVRRSELVPSARERRRRRTLIGAAIGVAVVGLVVVAARFWPDGASVDEGAERVATYAPLDRLEARVVSGPGGPGGLFAQHLRELDVLAAEAPDGTQGRVAELRASLRAGLRAEVNAVRSAVDHDVGAALGEGDFVAAFEVLDDVDGRLLRATGFAEAELEEYGVRLKTLAYRRAEVERKLAATFGAIERRTEQWVAEARGAARRAFDRGDWTAAWEIVDVSREDLLREVGFADVRLPVEDLAERLHPHEWELQLQRRRLVDRWTAMDRELVSALEARTAELEADLAGKASSVFDSVRRLTQYFDRKLAEYGIVLESLPAAFHSQAAAGLAERIARLREAEEARLERDVRAEYALIERLARKRLLRRDYASVVELWHEVAAATERDLGSPDAGWRTRVRAGALRRAEAARRLDALLLRAAERIAALNGRRVELYLGGIPRTGTIVAGVEPLVDGFRFVDERGEESTFELATLPARAFERLLGWRRPRELGEADRLDLALFAFACGDHERANEVLLSGATAETGLESDLEADLRIDIEDARARGEDRALAREQEATDLLGRVFVVERQTHSPKTVLAEIDELLERYGDLSSVRERRDELVAKRAELRGDRRRATRESLEVAFPDAEVSLPRPHRVRLEFDLAATTLPRPWQPGSWEHDGLGWSDPDAPASWEELRVGRGLHLVLDEPLAWTAEGFRLELEVRPVDAGARERCLLVSLGGLHVALVDGTLPGSTEFRPRWLVSDAPLAATLARLREGEGRRERQLLKLEEASRVELVGSIEAGWVTLRIDDTEIGTFRNLRAPRVDAHVLELRCWEPVRLLRAAVETGR